MRLDTTTAYIRQRYPQCVCVRVCAGVSVSVINFLAAVNECDVDAVEALLSKPSFPAAAAATGKNEHGRTYARPTHALDDVM